MSSAYSDLLLALYYLVYGIIIIFGIRFYGGLFLGSKGLLVSWMRTSASI